MTTTLVLYDGDPYIARFLMDRFSHHNQQVELKPVPLSAFTKEEVEGKQVVLIEPTTTAKELDALALWSPRFHILTRNPNFLRDLGMAILPINGNLLHALVATTNFGTVTEIFGNFTKESQ